MLLFIHTIQSWWNDSSINWQKRNQPLKPWVSFGEQFSLKNEKVRSHGFRSDNPWQGAILKVTWLGNIQNNLEEGRGKR